MFKTCPQCGDEFVPHVEICPDCRVPLRAASESPTVNPEARATREVALADAIVLRTSVNPSELRPLAEALVAAGIACAIDTHPPGGGITSNARRGAGRGAALGIQLAVYVDARDQQAASHVADAWLREQIPDGENAAAPGLIDACPGCGEPLAPDAASCASCGLEFPPLEATCPRCGRVVALESERCGGCGYRP
jgi:uncharacterized OB-fold protein